MTTAAKIILHDWQRGKIPFFVPPPNQEDETTQDPIEFDVEKDEVVDDDKASASRKAIVDVISSQQLKDVQEDLFAENELIGEIEKLPDTES